MQLEVRALGAMTGLALGVAVSPSAWLRQLVNREQIALRSRALVDPAFDSLLLEGLCELEKSACKAESEYRDHYRRILQEKFGI